MYYPFFRGKQFELIAIRENAELLARSHFTPIIEPVKSNLVQLSKTVDSLIEKSVESIIIANPGNGDFSDDPATIGDFLSQKMSGHDGICPGILLSSKTPLDAALSQIDSFRNSRCAIIHDGFTQAKQLAAELQSRKREYIHIFIDGNCTEMYQRHFLGPERVLIRDGFIKRINRQYMDTELFSDLHLTFDTIKRLSGFGDFLIVGYDYQEEGGPAYAVALHLTYIDESQDGIMMIFHFVSDSRDSPADPAGKFAEALDKLCAKVEEQNSPILRTSAVEEFLRLRESGHFPGLGYVKKLSMQHHLELMSHFFESRH